MIVVVLSGSTIGDGLHTFYGAFYRKSSFNGRSAVCIRYDTTGFVINTYETVAQVSRFFFLGTEPRL